MKTNDIIQKLKKSTDHARLAIWLFGPAAILMFGLAFYNFRRVYQFHDLFAIRIPELLGYNLDFMGKYPGYFVYAQIKLFGGICELVAGLFMLFLFFYFLRTVKLNEKILSKLHKSNDQ